MESVSHFMAFYCLIEQAAFENTCSNPDFLQLLALAPLDLICSTVSTDKTWVAVVSFQTQKKKKKLFHFPNPVKIMELIYIQWKIGLLGLNPPKFFMYKFLFVSLTH